MTTFLRRYGFWSYARKDDDYSDSNRISQLHIHVQQELELSFGKEDVFLFKDTSDISSGAAWKRRITDAINQSSFLIPVITPTFLQRPWCLQEVRMFLEREKELCTLHREIPRESLIFPIGYREIRDDEASDRALIAILRERQWIDIETMLDLDLKDPQVWRKVRKLVKDISSLLRIPIETDAERRAEEPVEATILTAREEESGSQEKPLDSRNAKGRAMKGKALAGAPGTRSGSGKAVVWQRRAPAVIGAAIVAILALVALIILVVGVWPRRSPTDTEAQAPGNVIGAPGMRRTAGTAPLPVTWLYARWSPDGNCRVPFVIAPMADGFQIAYRGERHARIVDSRRSSDRSVVTDQEIFVRDGDGVRVVENGREMYRLTPCRN